MTQCNNKKKATININKTASCITSCTEKGKSMHTVNMFRLTDTQPWKGKIKNKNMPLLHSKAIL